MGWPGRTEGVRLWLLLYSEGPFPRGAAASLAQCLAARIVSAAHAHGGSMSAHLRTVPPLASPQPQDCHTVVARLSHTCTQGRVTKMFSSGGKGPIYGQMKQVKMYWCNFEMLVNQGVSLCPVWLAGLRNSLEHSPLSFCWHR